MNNQVLATIAMEFVQNAQLGVTEIVQDVSQMHLWVVEYVLVIMVIMKIRMSANPVIQNAMDVQATTPLIALPVQLVIYK